MRGEDWTADEIIRALSKKGIKLHTLLKQYHLDQGLHFKYQQLEVAIAFVLNVPLAELWPSRYLVD